MPKIYFSILIIFFASSYAFPQFTRDKQKERIIWSTSENCGALTSVPRGGDQPKCNRVDVEGKTYRLIFYQGLSIGILYWSTKTHIGSLIQITNNSGTAIEIDPMIWFVNEYNSEDDAQKEDAKPKIFKATAAEKIRVEPSSVIVHSYRISATNPAVPTETNSRETTVAKKSISRDEVVKPSVSDPNSPPPGVSGRLNDVYVKNQLHAGSIPDKGKVAGYVFFDNTLTHGYKVLVVSVNGVEMIFPI